MSEVPLHTSPPRHAITDKGRAGTSTNILKGLKELTCQNMAVTVLCVLCSFDNFKETLAPYSCTPRHAILLDAMYSLIAFRKSTSP